jgi:hypothetical protein
VRVRLARRWRDARAEVLPDDDPEARLASFGRAGLATFGRAGHAAAVRRFGTDLVTVRFDLS